MIEQTIIDKKKASWTRQQLNLMNLMQDLEKDIQSMQKRGVNAEYIQKKSDQIDVIISAMNYAAELIDLLIFDRSSASIEIFCLQDQLSKYMMENPDKIESFLSKENTFELLRTMVQSYKNLSNEDQA